MELLNCCLQPLVTGIEISSVERDGQEVANLISTDPKVRGKGLQVERFVRPPIFLTLSLSLPVWLHYLVVWFDLKNEEECRMEVSAGSVTGSHGAGQPCQLSCGWFVVKATQPCLLLCNKQLLSVPLPNLVLGSHVLPMLARQQITPVPLKLRDALTKRVSSIVISVTKMTSSRPLAIKWLELWALPSYSCSKEQKANFEQVWKNVASSSSSPLSLATHSIYGTLSGPSDEGIDEPTAGVCSGSASDMLSTGTVNRSNIGSSVVVGSTCHKGVQSNVLGYTDQLKQPSDHVHAINHTPHRFLDEITYELMQVPMVLPSGHFVDQSTLQRSQECDQLYSRPPSDPFTGIPFSEQHSAKFCAKLKMEIDEYCSSQEVSAGSHERSVGSAVEIVQHLQSTGGRNTLQCNVYMHDHF